MVDYMNYVFVLLLVISALLFGTFIIGAGMNIKNDVVRDKALRDNFDVGIYYTPLAAKDAQKIHPVWNEETGEYLGNFLVKCEYSKWLRKASNCRIIRLHEITTTNEV